MEQRFCDVCLKPAKMRSFRRVGLQGEVLGTVELVDGCTCGTPAKAFVLDIEGDCIGFGQGATLLAAKQDAMHRIKA